MEEEKKGRGKVVCNDLEKATGIVVAREMEITSARLMESKKEKLEAWN